MKQFSSNLFYKKEKDLLKLFDSHGVRVVSLRFTYNDDLEMLSHSLENFNDKFKNIQYLNEIIFNLVMGALIESVKILKFHTIPLSKSEFNIIFQKFKNSYEEKIKVISLKCNNMGEISHLTIEISNPKNTHFIFPTRQKTPIYDFPF